MCLKAFVLDCVARDILPCGTFAKVMKLFLDYTKIDAMDEKIAKKFNNFKSMQDFDDHHYA